MKPFPDTQSDFYKIFSECSNSLLLYLDKDFRIQAINRAIIDKASYFDERLALGKTYPEVFGVDESTSVVLESLTTGRELQGLERLVNFNGKLLYLLIDTKVVRNADGEIEGLVCIFRDITVRKIEEQRLLTVEKQAVLGLLAAGVAHEIRNPLAAAMGFIQLMQQNVVDEKKQRKYLDQIYHELKNISTLVNNFMQLAKPTETNKQKISVTELLNETVDFMQGQAVLANVVIKRRISFGNVILVADIQQLKQVFINIIRNAIEASNKENAHIHISLEVMDGSITIVIEDNGIGIAPENIEKIYEPFFSTKKEGTGIGLSGVSQIIRSHNGTIDVESKVGEGTRFIIVFPCESP